MTQRPTRTTTPRIGDTVTAQGFDDPGQVDFIEDDAGEPMYSVQLPCGRLPFRGDQLTVCNEPNYVLLMGYSHVVMCCRYGDIDVVLAPSYDQALDYVRTRAAANDWSSFCDDPVDLSTATLDQLNALYRGDDAADESWVRIDHVAQLGALPLYVDALAKDAPHTLTLSEMSVTHNIDIHHQATARDDAGNFMLYLPALKGVRATWVAEARSYEIVYGNTLLRVSADEATCNGVWVDRESSTVLTGHALTLPRYQAWADAGAIQTIHNFTTPTWTLRITYERPNATFRFGSFTVESWEYGSASVQGHTGQWKALKFAGRVKLLKSGKLGAEIANQKDFVRYAMREAHTQWLEVGKPTDFLYVQ